MTKYEIYLNDRLLVDFAVRKMAMHLYHALAYNNENVRMKIITKGDNTE